MKFKRFLVVLLVITIWSGTMVAASAASQKVRVFVNGNELSDGGLLDEGTTYLPLRAISNTLQSLIVWDDNTKRIQVYKPNVHMFLFQNQKVFGNVDKDSRITFNVMAQVDNLKADISALKIVIADPSGKEELIQSQDVVGKAKDNFWFPTKEIRYHFSSGGKYAVRCYMKLGSNDDWVLVSEKTISAE
ncbi:copper amine oxidase [Paenibacillaceae bacterium]|nr:copper amine oxidase [Paenibacillaceae bacterium]